MFWLSIVNHSVYFTAKQKKYEKVNIIIKSEIFGIAKAFFKNVFKKDRRRSDTVLVLALTMFAGNWQALTEHDI